MLFPFVRPDRLGAAIRMCAGAVYRKLFSAWWRELLLIGVLYGAYEISRGLGDVDMSDAVDNGRQILHLEKVWHLDPEQILNNLLHHATFLAVFASYFYSVMHYLVTPAVLIWMYRSHRADYGRARTALALSTGLGLIGYLFLPTAPPRMVHGSGLRDILADTQRFGWWGHDGSVPRGWGEFTNQFAAMPSLHVGWAVWCGAVIALYARRRWVRALGVSYPLLTTFVVMATGNHYLLDAVAGAVVMALGALLTHAVPERFVTVPMGPSATVIERPRPEPVDRAPVTAQRLRSMADWEPPVPAEVGASRPATARVEERTRVDDRTRVDERYCRPRR
jgi:hypothetical protein